VFYLLPTEAYGKRMRTSRKEKEIGTFLKKKKSSFYKIKREWTEKYYILLTIINGSGTNLALNAIFKHLMRLFFIPEKRRLYRVLFSFLKHDIEVHNQVDGFGRSAL
jgi:hypothetical protein